MKGRFGVGREGKNNTSDRLLRAHTVGKIGHNNGVVNLALSSPAVLGS